MGPRPFPRHGSALVQLAGALLLCALLLPAWAHAQSFPALTGPVVDQAGVIPDDQEARIAQKLVALKSQTQRQLQVVTVSSLEGYDIADYANRLFRAWQLGDKQRNDGVMLLVAPNERKLRIEVGYGMEGTVTDGISFLVINQVIVPRLKAGDMPGGIEAGTDALIKQMSLPAEEAQQAAAQASVRQNNTVELDPGMVIWLVIFVLFFVLPMIRRIAGGRRYHSSGLGQVILWNVLEGMARGGGGGGGGGWGGGGGGWGGGGGSSGGGGASGSW